MIAAAALILATVVSGLFNRGNQDRYPAIEVKDITPLGERTLARLALSPVKQLVDSVAFDALIGPDLLWNDSLGVAIRKPQSYEWGAGAMEHLEAASIDDVLLMRAMSNLIAEGFGDRPAREAVRYFGVRLDTPTRVILTRETRLDSTHVGNNPFRDLQFFLGIMRTTYGYELDGLPRDSMAAFQKDAIAMLDSVAQSYLPSERMVYSGVFVTRITPETLPRQGFTSWLRRSLIDDAVAAVRVSTRAPTFLIVDRDQGTFLFSDVVRIENAVVDGVLTPSVTLNRAGYAIERESTVYVVFLQYLSSQPPEVLEELQRYLTSVRLRAES